ncbi:MAG: hypothetical protein IPI35_35595 [Deltaproteobacteria bacterium]|nr:hypothetical protein [Deltaproteobacteria bacterium]
MLLHATLEDLLRSLEIELIDRCIQPRMRLDKVKFALPGEGKLRETISLKVLLIAYPNANTQLVLADALAAYKPERLKTLQREHLQQCRGGKDGYRKTSDPHRP